MPSSTPQGQEQGVTGLAARVFAGRRSTLRRAGVHRGCRTAEPRRGKPRAAQESSRDQGVPDVVYDFPTLGTRAEKRSAAPDPQPDAPVPARKARRRCGRGPGCLRFCLNSRHEGSSPRGNPGCRRASGSIGVHRYTHPERCGTRLSPVPGRGREYGRFALASWWIHGISHQPGRRTCGVRRHFRPIIDHT